MRILSGHIRTDLNNMMQEMRKLSIFTHGIKNNLTPLSLAESSLGDLIQIFSGTKPSYKAREGLKEIEEAYEVMNAVKGTLTSLLESSLNHVKHIKIDYVKLKSKILPVVNQTIKGIACHKYLTGKNIRVNADQDLPECNSNALDIQRVLQNLIINAGFITQEGGDIEVDI